MSAALLLGSIDLDYAPLQSEHLSRYLRTFLQDAGGFALLGLILWLCISVLRSLSHRGSRLVLPLPILGIIAASAVLYGVGVAGSYFGGAKAVKSQDPFMLLEYPPDIGKWWDWCFTIGGGVALIGVIGPFLLDFAKLRFRRVFALAKLTILEAVRGRFLWVFLLLLLPFLFPAKWFFLLKPEDELSTSISILHVSLTIFLMLAAAWMASFSIPTDIRTQTIHTIVTKPVERFEIVIGRFLGHMFLFTALMLTVTAFSWVLAAFLSNVHREAREESMKARVPVYGDIVFQGPPGSRFQGESVGREFDRRRYVPGGPNSPYRAKWIFLERNLPRRLTSMPNDAVRCEFKFDIFRTTKGEENKGVFCTFFFTTHETEKNLAAVRENYRKRINQERILPTARPDGNATERADWAKLVKIVEEFGYYEFTGKEVVDYHTLHVIVPSTIFKKAFEGTPEMMDHPEYGRIEGPRFIVSVRCDSRTQFIGVKPNDLYLLSSEGNFHVNYFKGVAGLWLRICLVVGVAVTCSTYLNGVVSFLATLFLIGLGFFRGFIIMLAMTPFSTDVANPGPTDSLRKLITNEALGVSPDTTSPTQQVTLAMDDGFRWCLRRLLNVIPNTERLTWTDYVANGFDVPMDDVSLNALMVAGYLLMWALLGHYLIKWREVATW